MVTERQSPFYSPYLHFHAIKAQPMGIRKDYVRDSEKAGILAVHQEPHTSKTAHRSPSSRHADFRAAQLGSQAQGLHPAGTSQWLTQGALVHARVNRTFYGQVYFAILSSHHTAREKMAFMCLSLPAMVTVTVPTLDTVQG